MPQRDLSNLPKVKNPDSVGDSCLCLKLSAYTNLLVNTFAKYHCIFTRGGGSNHLQFSRSTAISSGLFPVMVQGTGTVNPAALPGWWDMFLRPLRTHSRSTSIFLPASLGGLQLDLGLSSLPLLKRSSSVSSLCLQESPASLLFHLGSSCTPPSPTAPPAPEGLQAGVLP